MTQGLSSSGIARGVLISAAMAISGPAWSEAANEKNPAALAAEVTDLRARLATAEKNNAEMRARMRRLEAAEGAALRVAVPNPQTRAVTVPPNAMAADRPWLKGPPPRPYDWTGSYVGFHVGLGNSSSGTAETWDWFTNFPNGTLIGRGGGPLLTTTGTSFNTNFTDHYGHSSAGLLGGLQWGRNWQLGRVVLGVEGDFSLTTQGDTVTYGAQPVPAVFPPLPNFFFIPGTTQGWMSEQRLDWLTTWRARVGWAEDSTLWYLSGGLAAGEIDSRYRLFSSPGNGGLPAAVGPLGPGTLAQWGIPGGLADQSFRSHRVGWALGGGVETALSRIFGWPADSRWTIKGEYLFVDLGNISHSITTTLVPICGATCASPATGSTGFTSSSHIYEQIARVGLNYRFDAEPQPLRTAASVPTADWAGFYAGFNVGAGKDSSRETDTWDWNTSFPAGSLIGLGGGPLFTTTSATLVTTRFSDGSYRHSAVGLAGGFEAGRNWQWGHVVAGVEGDVTLSTQKDMLQYGAQPVAAIFPPLPNFFFIPGTTQGWITETRLDWLTTLRGRLGWAQGSHLWYVTGGAAVADVESTYTLFSSPGNAGLLAASGIFGPGTFAQWGLPGGQAFAQKNRILFGYALGGGVETSLADLLDWPSAARWTAKLEYMFVDLGKMNNWVAADLVPVCAATCAAPATGGTGFTASTHVYEQFFRVGVNYRFN